MSGSRPTRTPTARPRSWASLALAVALGCPSEGDSGPPQGPAPHPNAKKTAELRKQAQKEALQRLDPKVAALAALEDPVTAAIRDGSAPAMPPVTVQDRARLRTALETASREADGLTPRLLDPVEQFLARACRFAINRVRDLYVRRGPWVDDPTWFTREAGLVVDALELASRRAGTCVHCGASLPQLASTMRAAPSALERTSTPRAEAAAADARALALRVTALPHADSEEAAAALEAFAVAMEGEAADADAPPRWDPKTLRRHLEVEENLSDPAEKAFERLGSAVATLSALAAQHPVSPPEDPGAVTAQRCAAAWSGLEAVIASNQALDGGDFTCAKFVEGVGTAAFDDAALGIAIVDAALVEPQREAAIRAVPSALSAIGGRITRGSQTLTLRAALLLGSPALQPAAAKALQAELDAACLAAAALWVHGELGKDDALADRLDPLCPRKTPEYIRDAQARPRKALEGLALARITEGPAGVVPLDKLWWLPYGLLEDADLPPPAPAKSPSPLKAVVEPIEPGAPAEEP